ncbi:hypothetical protein HDK77DRAFT_447833, partial [Phyllosticta capitalensis]
MTSDDSDDDVGIIMTDSVVLISVLHLLCLVWACVQRCWRCFSGFLHQSFNPWLRWYLPGTFYKHPPMTNVRYPQWPHNQKESLLCSFVSCSLFLFEKILSCLTTSRSTFDTGFMTTSTLLDLALGFAFAFSHLFE